MENQQLTDINSYLVFRIGEEHFAANAGKVQRILEMQPVTLVPKAQVYMKGVINLMGKALPVIDARLKMGYPEKEPDNNTCIIILEVFKNNKIVETGIIVDSVQSVIEIEKDEIKDPPELGFDVNSDFISGMVEQDNKFVMLLDIDGVFTIDDIISIEAMTGDSVEEDGEEVAEEKEK